ncbi:LysE family translocator [Acinetobacter sp. YH12254]|uniref:LysE family translocator n=1 Tax=Acinetobacter sp. YH12254 TaxID=2601178 RepID=UPI0015D46C20
MESFWILGSIAVALMLGAMSPGPTSIYVAKNSIAISRKHGLFTALGTGLGAAIFGLLAVLGLQAFLLAVPSAYLALKICGGLYLLWLAFKIIKHAKDPIEADSSITKQMSLRRAFTTGLITQLSNPKIAIVLASIFTALLPKEIPNYFYFALPILCFFIDAGWCSLVAIALSAEKPRRVYLKFKALFDRAAGVVMTVLGLKLIFGMK